MVWRVLAQNDPREKTLHVGVTRGSPGEVTTVVAAWGKLTPLEEVSWGNIFRFDISFPFQEDHCAVFAGSDDGFIAQYDEGLNFCQDWLAQEHGVNCLAAGRDEAATSWLYSASAFGEVKQWLPAALELRYQNTAEHPGSDSKVGLVLVLRTRLCDIVIQAMLFICKNPLDGLARFFNYSFPRRFSLNE